jgi:hypothetical protein
VRQAFLDLTGGVKPGLLAEIANGQGFVTSVTWKPSTTFALGDAHSGAPWATYHPFPVQCVARTDQTDLGSGVTSTVSYSYHLRRKVLSTTVWGLDGSAQATLPYSVTTSVYSTLVVASSLGNGDEIAVPYTVSTTEQRWERQAAPISTRVVSYGVIDEEGDLTSQRTTATSAGAAAPDQDIITFITYATGGKNLRLPARVTQMTADGSVIGANVTYYDGDPYIGLPEGQTSSGLETRIEDLVFTTAPCRRRRRWRGSSTGNRKRSRP